MTTLSLAKKQTISLEKTAGTKLSKVHLGLGWDPAKVGLLARAMGGGGDIDLDASCLMLDSNKSPVEVVWFRELKSANGSVKHSGDNRTGDGDGDDETIYVDLNALPSNVQYLMFTVNSFTGVTFDKVENAYCRIVDSTTNKEMARITLGEKGKHTGMLMAYLSRNGGDWTMTGLGAVASGRTVDDLITDAKRLIA